MIKVEILENDVFYGIDPIDVEKYLSSNNWVQKKLLPNDVAIWSKRNENDGIYRLWLPLDNELIDFAESMKKAISVIAQEEDRSQLELIEDFNTVALGDIIRLTSFDRFNHASSSVLLSHGKALINQAGDLITAAAMSENQAREVHPSRKANVVGDYLKSVRLGQTEPGSYTVKLVSPMSEVEEDKEPVLPETPSKLPFSRRAVIRLMTGLEAVQDVARDIHRRGKFDLRPFLEVVPQGVSANLCEAIADETSRELQNEYGPVDISITWSYSIPSEGRSRPFNINFPVEYMGYIARAATEIREHYPERILLSGYIKVLSREQGESAGTVSMVTRLHRSTRVVKIPLEGENYLAAIRAHENDYEARVEGDLIVKGTSYRLDNISGFTVEEPHF